MPSYIALLRKDPTSDYGVEFPDFPGCVTAGSNLEEARSLAEEALAFHLEGMLADGESLPEPSGFEQVMADPTNRKLSRYWSRSPQARRLPCMWTSRFRRRCFVRSMRKLNPGGSAGPLSWWKLRFTPCESPPDATARSGFPVLQHVAPSSQIRPAPADEAEGMAQTG